MSDVNQDRKKAVREAWKTEKAHVHDGKGTRDWSQSEQRQIVAKGRANGYEGHHMKSVKSYPQHAGNPHNIQFLNRVEHINGAHKGDTKNPTNGYYNPKTGTMKNFGNSNPQSPQSQALSAPLTQRQQNIALKAEQARKQAAMQAKNERKQSVSKLIPNQVNDSKVGKQAPKITQNVQVPVTTANKEAVNKGIESMRKQATKTQLNSTVKSAQPSHNKGIETSRQKAVTKESIKIPSKSSNQGIQSFINKTNGQVSNTSRVGTGKGSIANSGKPGGGQSSGNGQGRF